MSASLARRRSSTEVHSLDLKMAKASIDVHRQETSASGDVPADIVSLVVESLAAIGMDDKEACITMAFDASQFSKVKQGRARLPIDALWRLPDRFWLELNNRIIASRHLTPENAVRLKAARIGELVRLLVEVA